MTYVRVIDASLPDVRVTDVKVRVTKDLYQVLLGLYRVSI